MVSHDQESHVVPDFIHLDLTNALVLLILPSELCDADASIRWPKSHVVPQFDHLNLTNTMLLLMMPSASHDTSACIKVLKKSSHTSF